MIYVGIDVAKDKHDCFICNSEGEVLFNAFTFTNTKQGFNDLFSKIKSVATDFDKVKLGLEPQDITVTIFWVSYLIKIFPPLSSIRYIQIFTEKVLALERRKRIKLTPVLLL
jgi:hypothetical protein